MSSHQTGELHKIGVKWPAREQAPLDLLDLIPIYHRWISEAALPDLLIDVAEYTHVPHGPGVLIIAFEGNYAYDETGGERGVVYYSKQPLAGDLAQRLAAVARKSLLAGQRFEQDAALGGKVGLAGDRLEVFSNDRLAGPNDAVGWALLEPAVTALATRLFGAGKFRVERASPDPRERLTAIVHVDRPETIDTLLLRLA